MTSIIIIKKLKKSLFCIKIQDQKGQRVKTLKFLNFKVLLNQKVFYKEIKSNKNKSLEKEISFELLSSFLFLSISVPALES